MRIDQEDDECVYIVVVEHNVVYRTIALSDSVNLDLDQNGVILGIEILGPVGVQATKDLVQ